MCISPVECRMLLFWTRKVRSRQQKMYLKTQSWCEKKPSKKLASNASVRNCQCLHLPLIMIISYSGYDDAEFDSDYDETDALLPQYNTSKKKEKSFTLTDTGVNSAALAQSQLQAAQRVAPSVSTPAASSPAVSSPAIPLSNLLASLASEKKVASEYFTPDEMAQFRRKKHRVRRVRKSVGNRGDYLRRNRNRSLFSSLKLPTSICVPAGKLRKRLRWQPRGKWKSVARDIWLRGKKRRRRIWRERRRTFH